MPTDHPASCQACRKLPELLLLASSIKVHDARLEELLREVESLLLSPDASAVNKRPGACKTHLPLLQELQPRLQQIYEALLVERHQLSGSLSELDALHGWSRQWSTHTAQSTRSIDA